MPQHVGMHEEGEFRRHARPGNHALTTDNGAPRSEMKTFGDGGASRRSLRSARLSRADIGCTLASPLLALRTCKRPVARSMSSQRSVTSSEALRPWR
jgi:hypothetical protein